MWLEILIVLVTLLLMLYTYLYTSITKRFDVWEKLGVPHDKPSFPCGSHNLFSSTSHISVYMLASYNKFKDEKFFGWFLFSKPILNINDIDLVKAIKVKDFNHFTDIMDDKSVKMMKSGGDLDRLFNGNIVNAKGDEWKDIRATFSPIFTSGKMKGMMQFLLKVSENMTTELGEKAAAGAEFETKEVFGKFSLDALASCAFGMDGQSFSKDTDSVFVRHAKTIFQKDPLTGFLMVIKFIIPGLAKLYKAFNINVEHPGSVKFFRDVVLKSLQARRESKERRNDLIDLMLDCINEEEEIKDEEEDEQYHQDMKFTHKKKKKLDELAIVSNAILLLVVGYDTTGMTLSYLAYALSNHPDIQQKLQEEVDQAFEAADGEFPDYTTVQSLPYVDMVIHETLRLYSPAPLSMRTCTQDYILPGTDFTIKRNDTLSFCVEGFHTDPRYFSHPDQFYPEHFSKEEKSLRNPHAFQGFGQGPRACLGMRFALLEAKVAVLGMVRRFVLLPGTKTQLPLMADPRNELNWPLGGLWVRVEERRED